MVDNVICVTKIYAQLLIEQSNLHKISKSFFTFNNAEIIAYKLYTCCQIRLEHEEHCTVPLQSEDIVIYCLLKTIHPTFSSFLENGKKNKEIAIIQYVSFSCNLIWYVFNTV